MIYHFFNIKFCGKCILLCLYCLFSGLSCARGFLRATNCIIHGVHLKASARNIEFGAHNFRINPGDVVEIAHNNRLLFGNYVGKTTGPKLRCAVFDSHGMQEIAVDSGQVVNGWFKKSGMHPETEKVCGTQ